MLATTIHLNHPEAINYAVRETGFYCVSTYGFSGEDYRAIVSFNNAYGELPATQIAKLPFYGTLTIIYAVIGAYVLDLNQLLETMLTDLGFGPFYMRRTAMTSVGTAPDGLSLNY